MCACRCTVHVCAQELTTGGLGPDWRAIGTKEGALGLKPLFIAGWGGLLLGEFFSGDGTGVPG